jgi:hypothetical protein
MIEKHLYTAEEKTLWFGDGEWVKEPDIIAFEHCGLQCKVIRNVQWEDCEKLHMYGGHLCGYVGIDKDHPYHAKSILDILDIDLDAHGGVNFYEGGWIGFDCAHSGDLVPSIQLFKSKYSDELSPIPENRMKYSIFNPVYRNVAYVIEECKKLAEQLQNATRS